MGAKPNLPAVAIQRRSPHLRRRKHGFGVEVAALSTNQSAQKGWVLVSLYHTYKVEFIVAKMTETSKGGRNGSKTAAKRLRCTRTSIAVGKEGFLQGVIRCQSRYC